MIPWVKLNWKISMAPGATEVGSGPAHSLWSPRNPFPACLKAKTGGSLKSGAKNKGKWFITVSTAQQSSQVTRIALYLHGKCSKSRFQILAGC